MSRNSALALVLLALAGCDGTMRHEDGIAPWAGEAQAINLAVHTADVTAATVRRPNPGGDGRGAVLRHERARSGGDAASSETSAD